MKLLPADIVLTSSPTLLSRGLLWGQRDPGEAPTRAGHVALVSKPAAWDEGSPVPGVVWANFEDGLLNLAFLEFDHTKALDKDEAWRHSFLIESTWPRVIEERTLQHYLDSGRIFIFRRKDLTMHGREAVVDAAREHLGERYGLFGLYWQLVRAVAAKAVGYPIYWTGLLFGRKWRGPQFRSLARHNLTKPVYCSQLAALVFETIGVLITDEDGEGASPDGIDDYMCGHPDQFEVIYP